jgi:TetR/AcrR family transcriptional regulator
VATPSADDTGALPRWWGEGRSVQDDDEARLLLMKAAGRCIARRGDASVPMGEVAHEAGVTRSTLYRYFDNRGDLLVALVTYRINAAFARIVEKLPHPEDPARSIPDFVLAAVLRVDADPLNVALFSERSRGLIATLGYRSDAVVEAVSRHLGPLLRQWQAEGRLHGDLDLIETIRWVNVYSATLLSSPWRERSGADKRQALEQYLVRALVVPN